MNTIDIRIINKDSNWKELEWFIDDIRLSEHLCNKKIIELSEKEESFDDLCPAWTKELDYSGDVKFVWYLIGLEKAILPIYMCPDDLDFSCTVVVVEVEKTNNSVHWKRAGYVSVDSGDEVNYNEIRIISYCLAIATIAFVFGGVLILGTILQEKQDHVYSRILLTKANKASYLLSKIILVVGISLFQALVMLISFSVLVKANIGITTFQFFIIVLMEGLIFNFLSVCAGLYCRSMAGSAFLSFVIWSMSALLSGSYFDIAGASENYKRVALLMPERWAMFSVSRFQNGRAGGYSLILCATMAYLVIIFVVGILGLKLNEEE